MRLIIEKPATIITPTTGNAFLSDAIDSVLAQTYKNVNHLLVIDGKEYSDNFYKNIVYENLPKNVQIVILPTNTGANGFNGQRIYAAFPHLVDSDYILFLDEDNWLEKDHVSSLVDLIETKKYDWAYSLRNVYTEDKKFVAEDNCESIGRWPIFWSLDKEDKQHIVDTSCYCFTKNFIKQTCHLWHSGAWGEDRRYFHAIMSHDNYGTTGKHTSNYRLDDAVEKKYGSIDFFKNGNKIVKNFYGEYPWLKI
jgi:glycosyltransferase involved in cell wall biosynthesis